LTAFDRAWDLVKMPFVNTEGELGADVLYQGRRTGDEDTGHWTPHKSKAMAYAMFGPRYDYDGTAFVDANKHYPELYMLRSPKENIPLSPDIEYMDGEQNAINRGRVAFVDNGDLARYYEQGLVDKPQKLSDEHVADIIQNIIDSELYQHSPETDEDMEWEEYEEELAYEDEPNDAFNRIFKLPKGVRMQDWEGIYPTENEDSPLLDALSEKYEDTTPLWDKITTNDMLVNDSFARDFVRRLRERGQ